MRWAYLSAGTLLLGLVSFAITASTGAAVILVWSIVVGALSLLFVRLVGSLGTEAVGGLAAMLMGGVVVAFGGLIKWLTGSSNVGWPDAVGVLVAQGAAWGLEGLLTSSRTRACFICKVPVEGAASFSCPRCQQLICTRPSCWIARHYRCRYCEEREVIIFPIEERWWRARLGARVSTGACGSCYRDAGEADLRECRQCGWPMCKRCWDYHNGQCAHCNWVVPDLPPALTPFLGATRQPARGSVQGARRSS